MPETSLDKIANEAVIETVLPETRKLSIALRCCRGNAPSCAALRSYVGEIYSQLWDCALQMDDCAHEPNPVLPDVVVYPQNLPNAAPESWIDIQPDLDCVCSHDEIVGWSSVGDGCRGLAHARQPGDGVGGLDEHVSNVNAERRHRRLPPVRALHVPHFGTVQRAAAEVVFLDDEEEAENEKDMILTGEDDQACEVVDEDDDDNMLLNEEDDEPGLFLSGAAATAHLYDNVCVGGTFDGMHFGHRKLLTLAVSSVSPVTGSLLVGVTVDAMLRHKTLAEYIPTFRERCQGVKDFLYRLAPGMKNRVSVVPIEDSFGPPGKAGRHFDALVLSHETLETGYLLNQHRTAVLHLPPLKLLCTRRTEAHGMSSTALRRLRRNLDHDSAAAASSSASSSTEAKQQQEQQS